MDSIVGYVTHSLNKSKAKAAFSFPRASRKILQLKKSDQRSFYNLPSMKSNRACSLGYGSKTSLQKKDKSPPPGTYQSQSQFNAGRKNSAISFGLSRDKIKFSNFIEEINEKRRLPAPNSYRTVLQTLDKKGGRMAIRLPTQLEQLAKKKIPGPGTYNPHHLNMSDSATYMFSKFRNNASSPRYYNPQHQQQKEGSRIKTLGPCSYQVAEKQFGKFVLSKFRNSVAGTIGKSKRKGLIQKFKLQVPGYKYRSFSEFGQPQN